MEIASSYVWSKAQRGDREALQRFICAEPPKATYVRDRGVVHPSPWQLEAQKIVRALQPPLSDASILIATADDEIAAACYYGLSAEKDQFLIWALARDVRHAGVGLGAALLERVLQDIHLQQEALRLDCGVFVRVRPKNEASLAMFLQAGFMSLGNVEFPDLESLVHDMVTGDTADTETQEASAFETV